jgi:hypothetical protein
MLPWDKDPFILIAVSAARSIDRSPVEICVICAICGFFLCVLRVSVVNLGFADQVIPSGGGKFSRKKISIALYIAPTELIAFFRTGSYKD